MLSPTAAAAGDGADKLLQDEDMDAFNDDTFGVGAEEWVEDDHEALAFQSEQERQAREDAKAFFELGDDDDVGEELGGDPDSEPETNGNGSATFEELDRDFNRLQVHEPAQHSLHQQQQQQQQQQQPPANNAYRPPVPGPPPAAAVGAFVDDPAVLNAIPPQQQHQQQQRPAQMVHHYHPSQFPMHQGQARYMVPTAGMALPPGGDPAIMSVGGRLPSAGQFVPVAPQAPLPPGPPGLPPGMVGVMPPMPGSAVKTLAELEQEMLKGPLPPQTHMPRPPATTMMYHNHPPNPHNHLPHHHHLAQFRRGPPPPQFGQNQPGSPHHHHHHHPHHHHHHHHHHQQQQQQQGYPGHRGYPQQQQPGRNLGYHSYQQPHHHQHQHGGNRNHFDDKNRETFGDDLVDELHKDREQRRQQQAGLGGRHSYRDSAARRDLMPGHVHVLGILRDARERASTGNPNLDLELEKRAAEEAELRASYVARNPDDEYAGLMTPRERQWIINIQLQQLKCENPYIDDYYFTVYKQKKERAADEMLKKEEEARVDENNTTQPKRTEEGPQLLLQAESNDAAGKEEKYKPQQFTNSLGKLQAVTVKAPRKIIDVGIVTNDSFDGQNSETKNARNFKNTLMELERLYTTLIDVEDCDKKLAALPTGTAMHDQVINERSAALSKFCTSLSLDGRMRRFLLVRKGKLLLKRSLKVIGDAELQLFTSTLISVLPVAIKRDKEDNLIPRFWPELESHFSTANVDVLLHYAKLFNCDTSAASSAPANTFKFCIMTPFAMSLLLLLLQYLLPLHDSLSASSRAEAECLMDQLADTVSEVDDSSVVAPLFSVEAPSSQGLLERGLLGKRKEVRKLLAAASSS